MIKPNQKLILRNYCDDLRENPEGFGFHDNMIHDINDSRLFQADELQALFEAAGIGDGDEFEIIVKKTGNRPFGEKRFVYNGYFFEQETDAQVKLRTKRMTGAAIDMAAKGSLV